MDSKCYPAQHHILREASKQHHRSPRFAEERKNAICFIDFVKIVYSAGWTTSTRS